MFARLRQTRWVGSGLVFGHMVERRCKACGTAWLLTSQQARFSHRPPRRPRGPGIGGIGGPVNEEAVLALEASGSQMTSDAGAQLSLHDALRRCPKCQSEDFTDRRITRAKPASPDASQTELP